MDDDTNGTYDIFVRDLVAGTTTFVSVSSAGAQGNNESRDPAVSADGRYVTFRSEAGNLVDGDTNGTFDVFVHDRETGVTTRVSVNSAEVQGNGSSYEPALSADGRYVTFRSVASNLVDDDTNNRSDIFVRDLVTGTTTRVSVDRAGVQGNHDSYDPSISADGRYVAFESIASNLVDGDTNNRSDIFVHDLVTGTTTRVSVDRAGAQGNDDSNASLIPTISEDGRYVTFFSDASNLVANDTNGDRDVFVVDGLEQGWWFA